MARLTRPQKQAETRARLVEAATTLYLAHGVDGVSVEGVAEAAGYSKGAVYANFAGKEALLAEVWRRHYAAKRDRFEKALTVEGDEGALMTELRATIAATLSQGPWPILAAEIRRRPDLAALGAELAAMEAAEMAGLQAVVEAIHARLRRRPLIPADALTATLFALGEGLVLRDGAEPEEKADRFMAILRAALEAGGPADG